MSPDSSKRDKAWVDGFAVSFFGVVGTCFVSIPGFLYNTLWMYMNSRIQQESSVACVSYTDPVMEVSQLTIGVKGKVCAYFNSRGKKVDFTLNATSEDLQATMLNHQSEDIVVIGYGDNEVWEARDTDVSTDMVDGWGIPKKPGVCVCPYRLLCLSR